jgi:rare lipoprotein A
MNRTISTHHFLLGLVIVLGTSACSTLPKGEAGLDVGVKDRGIASWYGNGDGFDGKPAANGEIFDKNALTAAHRSLPLGSIVRVVNASNGRHVRVRINDRGPYVPGRMLDLSYAAARELGMVEGGISAVHVEVIGDHRSSALLRLAELKEAVGEGLVSRLAEPVSTAPGSAPDDLTRGHSSKRIVRSILADMLHERRVRRVAGVLANTHTAFRAVPTLLVA